MRGSVEQMNGVSIPDTGWNAAVEIDYAAAGINDRPVRGVPLIFSDPPYNIGVKYDGDASCDVRGEAYWDFVARTLRIQAGWMAASGTLWWMCPSSHIERVGPLLSAIVGPRVASIVWHEAFSVYRHKALTHDWRSILVHARDPSAVRFNADAIRVQSERQRMGDKRADPRGRIPGTVWAFRRLQGTSNDRVDWHPAQLPPELLERIVRGWSDPGDLVVDGFSGSGSMGVVAGKLGRRFAGCDRSRVYLRKMQGRLSGVNFGCWLPAQPEGVKA